MPNESSPKTLPPVATSRRADTAITIFALGLPTVATALYFVLLAGAPPWIQQSTLIVCKTIQFLLPVVWVYAIQRCRPRFYLPRKAELLPNLAFGLAVTGGMLALFYLLPSLVTQLGVGTEVGENIRGKVGEFGIDRLWQYVAVGVFYSLIHSGLEEYYWRWFVFGQLRRLVPLPAAIAISAIGFMGHHILLLGTYLGYMTVGTVFFSICVAVGGAVWAWLYHRYDSLWGPWLGHLLVDAGIFVIGYSLVKGLFVG